MALSLHDVLRALVRGDGAQLNDAQFQAQALQAIGEHEAGPVPPPGREEEEEEAP